MGVIKLFEYLFGNWKFIWTAITCPLVESRFHRDNKHVSTGGTEKHSEGQEARGILALKILFVKIVMP